MGSFASLRGRHRRGNPSCCAWSRTSRTGLTNRCTPPKRLGGNPLEARLRRCRWVTVRELVPTSQARLYPPLCAAAEAMSAGRGDMHIRVIWVLPGGGQQRASVARARMGCLTARVPVHSWACSLVVWGGDHRSPRPRHCSIAAPLRLAEVRPAPARLDPRCSRVTRVMDHDRSGACPSASAAARVG
jgi:hypothetical protein